MCPGSGPSGPGSTSSATCVDDSSTTADTVRKTTSCAPAPRTTSVGMASAWTGRRPRLAFEQFDALSVGSPEFGRLLRRLIPRIVVSPVRLCDGGLLVPRARFTLNLAALAPPAMLGTALDAVLRRELVVDLFDPPQREQIRPEAVALTAAGVHQRDAAKRLGVTQPAVQKAIALDQRMKDLGLV